MGRCIGEYIMGFSRPAVQRRTFKGICVQQWDEKLNSLNSAFASKITTGTFFPCSGLKCDPRQSSALQNTMIFDSHIPRSSFSSAPR